MSFPTFKWWGSGYAPISALLVNDRAISTLKEVSENFVHGHTYYSLPQSCAAALEVQRIIQEEKLVSNFARIGNLLERLLRQLLGDHPNVGDIRGRGRFWAVESG